MSETSAIERFLAFARAEDLQSKGSKDPNAKGHRCLYFWNGRTYADLEFMDSVAVMTISEPVGSRKQDALRRHGWQVAISVKDYRQIESYRVGLSNEALRKAAKILAARIKNC